MVFETVSKSNSDLAFCNGPRRGPCKNASTNEVLNEFRMAHHSENGSNNVILIQNIGRYRTPNPRQRETELELIGPGKILR